MKNKTCPKCGSFDIYTTPGLNAKSECLKCGHSWLKKMAGKSSTDRAMKNELKDKKQARILLVQRYQALKEFIIQTIKMNDIKIKHQRMMYVDKEFSQICKKKFDQYFLLEEFRQGTIIEFHEAYLNSRAKKMIVDIDRILFYFNK